jgi:hypothetical protein
LPVARELKKICLDMEENPKALDGFLYKDAGKTQIADFALNVPIAQHDVDNMAYVQKPTHLTVEQFTEEVGLGLADLRLISSFNFVYENCWSWPPVGKQVGGVTLWGTTGLNLDLNFILLNLVYTYHGTL